MNEHDTTDRRDAEPDFETGLARLQRIVDELERGDLPLERGVELFKQGLTLAKRCREQLATAKNEVTVYQNGLLSTFEPEGEDDDGPSDG
jgi:exodeoxyribonuclease VII small subunit